jgi:uncharacterized phage protein (TIGR01671 family)
MRQLKFRVWSKPFQAWAKDLCLYLDNSEIGDVSECFHNIEDKDDYIIQQYTGLKDKNGVDIYEGDTLIWYGKDHKAPVVFSPTSAAFVLDTSGRHLFDDKYGDHLDLHKDHEYEIVGNIFENSKLLEK